MDAQPISPYEVLTLVVSVISSITVVISLFLVYRQTRIFAKQTEYVARSLGVTLAGSMNDQSHEISRLFVQYPTLRPYFYDGQPIEETHPDFPRAEAIAELILDIFWTMGTTVRRYGDASNFLSPDGSGELWQNFVGESFAQSPILVNTLLKRRGWYGEAMVDQMNAGIKHHTSRTADAEKTGH